MALSTVFAKLQLKNHADIVVLGAPKSFERELKSLKGVTVHRTAAVPVITFAIAFVTTQREVSQYAGALGAKASGDAVLWFAYPKGSSKRLQSDISRDRGWEALQRLGFETVRLVAIDEDWSALRFRRGEYVGKGRKRAGARSAPSVRLRAKRRA